MKRQWTEVMVYVHLRMFELHSPCTDAEPIGAQNFGACPEALPDLDFDIRWIWGSRMALTLRRALARSVAGAPIPSLSCSTIRILPVIGHRHFSVLSRPPPQYEGHVPLTTIERAGLAVGSALWCFFDPTRAGIFSPPSSSHS